MPTRLTYRQQLKVQKRKIKRALDKAHEELEAIPVDDIEGKMEQHKKVNHLLLDLRTINSRINNVRPGDAGTRSIGY